jgi:hypothetical protein
MNKKNELIAMNEEAIADMQNIMMSEASGESPQAMMAMGGYLRRKKKMAYGGLDGPPYDLPGMADMNTSEYNPINTYLTNLNTPNYVDNQGNTSSILSRMYNNTKSTIPNNYQTPYQDEITKLNILKLPTYSDNLELPNNQPSIYNGPTNFGPITEDEAIMSTPTYQDEIDYTVLPDEPLKGVSTSNLYSPNTTNSPNNSILGKDADGNDVSINPNAKEGFVPEGYTKSKTNFNNDSFGIQPEDYVGMAAGALGGLSQLYYGLKGPDKVRKAKFNLARPSKVNYTPAKRLVSQEIDTAFNAADNDLRNNAPGAGSYLSNRIASAVKRARTKGENLIKLDESAQNAQIQNQFNQYNSGVLNQQELANLGQEDKIIQEKDAARQAVSEGLSNIGQSVGQGIRDRKSYNMQELKAKWSGTKDVKMIDGVKYYKQSDGSYKPEELKE